MLFVKLTEYEKEIIKQRINIIFSKTLKMFTYDIV